MKPYTVLLLRPDYLADEFGVETLLFREEANTPGGAVVSAQERACEFDADGPEDDSINPDDYHPLLVIEGHHEDVTPEPWR